MYEGSFIWAYDFTLFKLFTCLWSSLIFPDFLVFGLTVECLVSNIVLLSLSNHFVKLSALRCYMNKAYDYD